MIFIFVTVFLKLFTPKERNVWLSRKDVSELLRVSLTTLHDWGKISILKPYKIGNKVRYRQAEIENTLLASNKRIKEKEV